MGTAGGMPDALIPPMSAADGNAAVDSGVELTLLFDAAKCEGESDVAFPAKTAAAA